MKKTLRFITSLFCVALCGASAQGALSYWDSDDSNPGAGSFGQPSGAWGFDAWWSTDPNGAATTGAWTPDDTAVFAAGTDALYDYDVSLFGDQSVAGINVEEGHPTIKVGTITLTGAGGPFDVAAGAAVSMDTLLGGTVGLTKTGPGTLYFINQSVHTYTSDGGTTTNTYVNGGTLSVGNGAASGGTLQDDGFRGHHINLANNSKLIFNRSALITSWSGIISGSGSVTVTGTTATCFLKFASLYTNDYTGDTTISFARLQCGGSSGRCIPTGPGKGNVFCNTNGMLDLAGNNCRINGLFGVASGSVTNSTGSRTNILSVGDNNTSSTFSGVISKAGGSRTNHVILTKIGTGTLTLNGLNTYFAGPTTVSAGTLLANTPTSSGEISSTGNSPVNVNSGATLGGTGYINGPVTIEDGATLSPGASIGTLTINNSLTITGAVYIEVNKSVSPSNDLTSVSGTLTNGGTGTVTVANLGPALAQGDSFKIFNKAVVNGAAMNVVSVGGGVVWNNNLATDGSISVASAGAARPTITSIVGAGTTSVTVNYANTLAGTNYVVQYRTNLNTTNWNSLAPVTAAGATSSSTDTPPSGDPQRFYRVYYVTP